MSENTKIEWCDHTFNPWEGCQKTGPGCDHCYAEQHNARFGGGVAVNFGPGAPRRRTSVANWRKPLKWNANACWFVQCNTCGWRGESKGATCSGCHGCDTSPARPRVFCASLADVFDNAVDPQWRADLFSLIERTPNLDWLLLTKRIGNVRGMLAELAHGSDPDLSLLDMMPLPNVWIGATIVNQAEADRDIPKLLELPARVRFLSMEPLLGPVDLTSIDVMGGDGVIFPLKGTTDCVDEEGAPADDIPGLDWVIVGGESGPGARPMHPDWARSLRDQCQAACVPFLFKQWGHWQIASRANGHYDSDMARNSAVWLDHDGTTAKPSSLGMTNAYAMAPVGKKAAGRLLDGRTWDEVPA